MKLVEHHPELPVPAASTIGEPVGIRETEGGDWLVRYADVELGYIHSQRGRLSPRPLRGVIKPGDLMDIADAITTTPQLNHRNILDANWIKMSPIQPVRSVTPQSVCTWGRPRLKGPSSFPAAYSLCLGRPTALRLL